MSREKTSPPVPRARSAELLSLGILLLTCISVVALSLQSLTQEKDSSRALRKAESIGYQLIQIEALRERVDPAWPDRFPASVGLPRTSDSLLGPLVQLDAGEMGVDPWGQPFRFVVYLAHDGQRHLAVWSPGKSSRASEVAHTDPQWNPETGHIQFDENQLGVRFSLQTTSN